MPCTMTLLPQLTFQLRRHLGGQVCAPRWGVLRQTWREEEDGTHIVLLHSADHPAAHSPPPAVPGFWLHPVPVTVRPPAVFTTRHILRWVAQCACHSLFSVNVLQPVDPSTACKAPATVPGFWLHPATAPVPPAAILPDAHSLRLLAAPRLSTHVPRRLIVAYPMVLELPRIQGLSVRVLLKHLLCYYPRVGCSLQVVAAGFTIAPLQPRFTGGGASGECLVTLVLKLDDLGGWLSGARLGGLLLPWMRSILAEAAAGAVIALRDKA